MKTKHIIMTVIIVVIVNLVFYKYYPPKIEDTTSHLVAGIQNHYMPEEVITSSDNNRQIQNSISDNYKLQRSNAVTKSVKKTEASVVSINVIKTQVVRRSTNPFDNPFFGFFDYRPYRREVQSIGSGLIYNEDGYILTNSHVVEGATEIKVILNDGSQYEAGIIGMDSVLDIAVLKIEETDLNAITLGQSNNLLLGETVIAIGNPYAFLIKDSKPSVSVGVISAVNRNFSQDSGGKIYQGMVQTDAAINPGNSGGPLINILGEMIGMNTFIFSESGGSIGVGFAIPIDRIIRIAEEIIEYGRRRQIWFGFKIQDLNPMIASYLELDDLNGVIVSYIDQNSPAGQADLRRGDIIVRINEYEVNNTNDAEVATLEISIGESIELEVIRAGRRHTIVFQAVETRN